MHRRAGEVAVLSAALSAAPAPPPARCRREPLPPPPAQTAMPRRPSHHRVRGRAAPASPRLGRGLAAACPGRSDAKRSGAWPHGRLGWQSVKAPTTASRAAGNGAVGLAEVMLLGLTALYQYIPASDPGHGAGYGQRTRPSARVCLATLCP
jgi:hypothetical protein